ncbi:MAG: hypothetical protein GF315_07575 [candidate division Zixibacteria bacterium]|nr:hypothetical protein [candidate division Zixibacteria bacterium]
MHRILTISLLTLGLIANAMAYDGEEIPWYYSQHDFLMASPSAFYDGLLGFGNPANLNYLHNPDLRFHWSTDGTDAGSFNNWGAFLGTPGIGFGLLKKEFADYETTDYRIALGWGDDEFGFGIGYGWSSVTEDFIDREKLVKTGMIYRPFKYLSLGLVGDWSVESDARQGVAELGIRPLGTSRLTLFGDIAMQKKTTLEDAPWSAGAAVEVVNGLYFTGRYFENESFTAGLSFNFGHQSLAGQGHFDSEQEHSYNSYSVRFGGMRPSFLPPVIDENDKYLKLNLKGRVHYQKYRLFDEGTHRFLDILEDIKAAAEDPRVGAIALNVSSVSISREKAWEIREELYKARQKGKYVICFIGYPMMTDYHIASVADKIVIDPEGGIMLPGYAMGKTYFKGTLEKMGLGFDEWRFFKYKSAMESFSRESFSDPDREQYRDYVDDLYETTRRDICDGRGLTIQQFDSFVDTMVFALPETALELGLADTLGRWSDADDMVKKLTGRSMHPIGADFLMANALPPAQWGKQPEIAVVYGLGACAMDSGIKARWLERVFLGLKDNDDVKAVVFRVDSPGGDGRASDHVAQALKKCAERKPVIVSQGGVAASGGYWISMYGDKIVAGPNTITGSIGVIGGWIYDKTFSDKLGMSSDHVRRGAHADLGSGVRLPFLNLTVPHRNLTEKELERVENLFYDFYTGFVRKVADGRDMSEARVREIGEGHFYSGIKGKEIGLVDEIGGLELAIEIARERAGIEEDQRVTLREIPEYKGWFNFDLPSLPFGAKAEEDPVLEYIRMLNEHQGRPLPMLIPGTYPEIE